MAVQVEDQDALPLEPPMCPPARGRIRVGVTGHRAIAEPDLIAQKIDDALTTIIEAFGNRPLTVVSALAEGADRMVAERVLAQAGSDLHAVLPLRQHDYERDFEGTPGSVEAFRTLLTSASRVTKLGWPSVSLRGLIRGAVNAGRSLRRQSAEEKEAARAARQQARNQAYLAGGELVLRNCDVLIALWDGQPSRGVGGTGDIVDRARDFGLPIIWIKTANGNAETPMTTVPGDPDKEVEYERFVPPHSRFDTIDCTADWKYWSLLDRALRPWAQHGLAVYQTADDAALRHQRWHRRIALVAAFTGMSAVLAAIWQLSGLWFSDYAGPAELFMAITALASVILGLVASQQQAWLLQRHIAERCRMLKFVFVTDPDLWSKDVHLQEKATRQFLTRLDQIRQLQQEGKESSLLYVLRGSWRRMMRAIFSDPSHPGDEDDPLKMMERWTEEEEIPGSPLDIRTGATLDPTLCQLMDYYGAKRVGPQSKYFANRAAQNRWLDRLTGWFLPPLFFLSVIAAGGHFAYDSYQRLKADQERQAALSAAADQHEAGSPADTHAEPPAGQGTSAAHDAAAGSSATDHHEDWRSILLIVLAAGLPVIAGLIRTIRGTHEFARNRSRFHSKSKTLGKLAERIRLGTDPAHVFAALLLSEEMLESEHREWLRLMTEADWQP
jgi:hypothetical protein